MIAALYVEPDGAYYGLPGVDPWDEARDARKYAGPHPVVAHPPCQRWGRFWHGSTRKPHQFKLGDDAGCFAAALEALERFGGVLEHPCDSHAWAAFGLNRPSRHGGWVEAGRPGMWTCCVYQGHYGHMAGKPTWLLAKAPRAALPELRWGKGEQRLHPVALAKHGYAKARRIGMLSMIGGKDKTRIRNTTCAQRPAANRGGGMTDPRLIRLIRALENELGCSPALEVALRILQAIDGVPVASAREQFEQWMRRAHPRHGLERTTYPGDHGHGDYVEQRTHEKWETWLAARNAGVEGTTDRGTTILARITELDAERGRLWAEYEAHDSGVQEVPRG